MTPVLTPHRPPLHSIQTIHSYFIISSKIGWNGRCGLTGCAGLRIAYAYTRETPSEQGESMNATELLNTEFPDEPWWEDARSCEHDTYAKRVDPSGPDYQAAMAWNASNLVAIVCPDHGTAIEVPVMHAWVWA